MAAGNLEQGFLTQCNHLIELGHHEMTVDKVREFHGDWLNGDVRPGDQVYAASVDVFERFPHVFGERKSSSAFSM